MADRYDDYERGSQARRGEGREHRGNERGDFGREESENRNQGGNWQGEQERHGNRGNWQGEQERFGGRGERSEQYYGGQRGDYGGQRGEYNQGGDFGRNRDFGQRGDFGQGGSSQGGYNQGSYNQGSQGQGSSGGSGQRGGEQDWQVRGPDWQRHRTEWARERTGHEGPWGTGSQGFGTGYRSGELSSSYSGFGAYNSESYAGGAGISGEQRGRFSGKGPKGYQRSDDRIREDVCERLTQHPEVDASEIEIKVNNGEVTLTGTVDERRAKRMAEDVAENVSGVKEVHNQLRVHEREMAGATQHTGGTTTATGSGKEQTGTQRK